MRSLLVTALALSACSRTLEQVAAPQDFAASPSFYSLAPREVVMLTVTGGSAPFLFDFAEGSPLSGTGAVVTGDGLYQAGAAGSAQDLVSVEDAGGARVEIRISVGQRLQITPSSVAAAPGGSVAFSATGGKPPYAFSLGAAGSGGSVDASTGVYRAGSTGGVFDEVVVRDDTADSAAQRTASISVGVAVSLIASGGPDVAPQETINFVAAGGQPPYVFDISADGSGATIDASGAYQAGMVGDVADQVRVTDSNGETATSDLNVGTALTLTLPVSELSPGNTVRLVAAGGKPPYTFFMPFKGNRSGASVDPVTGEYTPGPAFGAVDDLRVRDATATAEAQLAPPTPVGPIQLPVGGMNGCELGDLDGDGGADVVLFEELGRRLVSAVIDSDGSARITDLQLDGQITDVDVRPNRGSRAAITVVVVDGPPSVTDRWIDFQTLPDGSLDREGIGSFVGVLAFLAYDPLRLEPSMMFAPGGWLTGVPDPNCPTEYYYRGGFLPGAGSGGCSGIALVANAVGAAVGDFSGSSAIDFAVAQGGASAVEVFEGYPFASTATSVALPMGQAVTTDPRIRNVLKPAKPADGFATPTRVYVIVDDGSPNKTVARISQGQPIADAAGVSLPADPTWATLAPISDSALYVSESGSGVIELWDWSGPTVSLVASARIQRPYAVGCITAGDVNADGLTDLVVVGAIREVTEVILGDGRLSLGRRGRVSAPGNWTTGELDGDGLTDLIAFPDTLTLRPLLGVSRQFATMAATPLNDAVDSLDTLPLGSDPPRPSFVAADFDGDGDGDVYYRNEFSELLVMMGDGAGGFGTSEPLTIQSGSPAPDLNEVYGLKVLELGGGALGPDLAWTQINAVIGMIETDVALIVLDTPTSGQALVLPAVEGGCDIVTLDFNGDMLDDIAAGCLTLSGGVIESRAYRALATAGGASVAFAPWETVPVVRSQTLVGNLPRSARLGDRGGEALFAYGFDGSIDLPFILAISETGFAEIPLSFRSGCGTMGMIDGDAEPDLVLCDLDSEGLQVLVGDGMGGFTVGAAIPGVPAQEVAIVSLGGAVNADDIVAQVGEDLIVFTNDGTGAFP